MPRKITPYNGKLAKKRELFDTASWLLKYGVQPEEYEQATNQFYEKNGQENMDLLFHHYGIDEDLPGAEKIFHLCSALIKDHVPSASYVKPKKQTSNSMIFVGSVELVKRHHGSSPTTSHACALLQSKDQKYGEIFATKDSCEKSYHQKVKQLLKESISVDNKNNPEEIKENMLIICQSVAITFLEFNPDRYAAQFLRQKD